MEPKKNPKADLTRNSGLYFAIGMAVVLFLTWQGLEWKQYDKDEAFTYKMDVDEDLEEEIPITEMLKTPPPPPPPPAAPEVIEVVEDDEEIEETVIESTESNQDDVVEVEEIVEVEEPVDVDVPFAVIEDVPVFPGCEDAKDKRACFQEMMQKHIRKHFRYPEIAQEMGVQGRVAVMFTIDKDGSITNVRLRGPDKNLEKEAERIISKLPKMTPGKQRGRAVRVPFSIPITFRLQ